MKSTKVLFSTNMRIIYMALGFRSSLKVVRPPRASHTPALRINPPPDSFFTSQMWIKIGTFSELRFQREQWHKNTTFD